VDAGAAVPKAVLELEACNKERGGDAGSHGGATQQAGLPCRRTAKRSGSSNISTNHTMHATVTENRQHLPHNMPLHPVLPHHC
jgi:hypothetical protein